MFFWKIKKKYLNFKKFYVSRKWRHIVPTNENRSYKIIKWIRIFFRLSLRHAHYFIYLNMIVLINEAFNIKYDDEHINTTSMYSMINVKQQLTIIHTITPKIKSFINFNETPSVSFVNDVTWCTLRYTVTREVYKYKLLFDQHFSIKVVHFSRFLTMNIITLSTLLSTLDSTVQFLQDRNLLPSRKICDR